MSVAPDIAPEVAIPARARRMARNARAAQAVSGNVITPSAFHPPCPAATPASEGRSRLRLVPVSGPARSGPARSERIEVADGRGLLVDSRPARLTARGRVVLALAALVIALGIATGAWFGAGSDAAPAAAPVPAQVVVHDGDTLWSIATRVAPRRDPRVTVEQLWHMNGLTSVALMPGQVLRTR